MKKLLPLIPPFLVFLAAFALFAPSIGYPLLDYDDFIYITRNQLVLRGFSLSSVWKAFSSLHGDTAIYSPLLWVSWMLDVSLLGASPSNPWPFHFGNVLLHALDAVLLYFILRRCRATPPAAALLSLLWALHPLRVESVAWVTERKDTLSTLFAFLAILFYLKAWERGRPARDEKPPPPPSATFHFSLFTFHCTKGCQCLALAAFGAGLLAKPMLVTLPFLFLLFDVFPLRRLALDRSFSPAAALRLVLEKIPFFALSTVVCVIAIQTQTIQRGTSLLQRLALVPLHYAFYLAKTFFPVRLTPFPPPVYFSWTVFVPVCLLFAVLVVSAWRCRLSRPACLLGLLAFFGLFVPVVGFFQFGINQVADRFSYLPAIGLSIAAIPFLSGPSRLLRAARTILAVLVLLALVPATVSTLLTWSSKDAFYARAGAICPDHPSVAVYRARRLITDHGDFAAAEPLLDAALSANPDNGNLRILKAVCLDERLGPAAAFDYFTSIPGSQCTPFELREAAQYALRAGKPGVVPPITDALVPTLPPSDAIVRDILYVRLAADFAAGDFDSFARTANQIPAIAGRGLHPLAAVTPHYFNQWSHLHRRDAWAFFKSLADNPDTPPLVLNDFAWLLSTAPGWNPAPPDEILAMARRAAEAAPDHPAVLDTLAAALANASDFPSAVETASRALELAAPDPGLSAQIRSRLDLYRKGLPFREDR